MTDRLLLIEEVAELTRVPVDTLRYWRHKGVGPKSFKSGRRVVWRETECLAWLEAQEREQAALDAERREQAAS